jgi:hypothetical protein
MKGYMLRQTAALPGFSILLSGLYPPRGSPLVMTESEEQSRDFFGN